jgi:ribonuclease P protein component
MQRLKTRADFLRAARGIRRVEGAVTLETCPTPQPAQGGIRVGFTASKKIGNAVARNRAKRRLRAAAAQLLPLWDARAMTMFWSRAQPPGPGPIRRCCPTSPLP